MIRPRRLNWPGRGVAQPGSALPLGGRGPRFESGRPDVVAQMPWRIVFLVAQFVLRSMAMSRSLHVRLDDSAAAALRVVRGDAGSDSEAVRTALREAAARRRARSSLIAEVERLAADDADREEMRIVREELAELAPDSVD